jgi:predicted ABC-type ATPase
MFPPRGFGTDFFSIDDRCAELNGGLFTGIRPGLRARVASECQRFVEQHVADRASFAVETTLRGDAAISQAEAANAAGFSTFLFFLATGDVRLNIERIAARGRKGGHSSPEAGTSTR